MSRRCANSLIILPRTPRFWPTERPFNTLADVGIGKERCTDYPGLECPICGHRRYQESVGLSVFAQELGSYNAPTLTELVANASRGLSSHRSASFFTKSDKVLAHPHSARASASVPNISFGSFGRSTLSTDPYQFIQGGKERSLRIGELCSGRKCKQKSIGSCASPPLDAASAEIRTKGRSFADDSAIPHCYAVLVDRDKRRFECGIESQSQA